MTREKQIKQASIEYTKANRPVAIGGDYFAELADALNLNSDFIAGAMWADQHPTVFNECVNEISADYHAGYNQGREDGRNISPWISVEERLPEEEQRVLVHFRHSGHSVGVYIREELGNFWGITEEQPFGDSVTHWLPIPPIEKGE